MPRFTIEQTATAAILWEGEHSTATEALAALEEQSGKTEGGWSETLVVHEYEADGETIRWTVKASEVAASFEEEEQDRQVIRDTWRASRKAAALGVASGHAAWAAHLERQFRAMYGKPPQR